MLQMVTLCPYSMSRKPRYLFFSAGELGLGPDEPKSSTKPTKHMPLEGIEVLQYVFLQPESPFQVVSGFIAIVLQ